MTTIILTIHILLAIALVLVVLLQRSEGGGLGIGGGGGGAGGGFMTARGAASAMTRLTAMLAAAFFCTSIALAILAGGGVASRSVVDEVIESESGGGAVPQIRIDPGLPTDQ